MQQTEWLKEDGAVKRETAVLALRGTFDNTAALLSTLAESATENQEYARAAGLLEVANAYQRALHKLAELQSAYGFIRTSLNEVSRALARNAKREGDRVARADAKRSSPQD